jgi:DNA repair exonuclease SbcCD ATPase subunit
MNASAILVAEIEALHAFPTSEERELAIADLHAAVVVVAAREAVREEARKNVAKLEQVRTRGIEVRPRVEQLREECPRAESDYLNAEAALNAALGNLANVRAAEPDSSTFPTPSEIAEWREALAKAEAQYQDSLKQKIETRDALGSLTNEYNALGRELAQLEFMERNLRASIAGS